MSERMFWDRYEPLRMLGQGGMGQVYLANDVRAKREVVLKIVHPHLANNHLYIQSLKREVDVLSRFRHPHAVTLYDAVVDDTDCPGLVMEYVNGLSLETLISQFGAYDVARTGRLLGQLCLVLFAAHTAGIIHRDLTAANLMIINPNTPSETLKVLDFGLAHTHSDGFFIPMEKLTGTNANIGSGTPDYMCPEQIRKEPVDHRADIYSAGVVLFTMLTGRLPFADCNEVADILTAQVERRPPSFAMAGNGTIPEAVEAVVHACLAKQPAERPHDARELAMMFGNALGQEIVDDSRFEIRSDLRNSASAARFLGSDVIDHLEAWMPESMATIKLRGFLQDFAGEIVASEPGVIRFEFAVGSESPSQEHNGLLSFFGFGKKAAPIVQEQPISLELHMQKSAIPGKLGITVVAPNRSRYGISAEHGVGEEICRELRAFLMTGRG